MVYIGMVFVEAKGKHVTTRLCGRSFLALLRSCLSSSTSPTPLLGLKAGSEES